MPELESLRARNHRRQFFGGQTCPQLFQCSDGEEWVLKLMGNTLGLTSLAADWLGSVLAVELGVATPRPEIVEVDEEALETAPIDVQAWAKAGPALGTAYILESAPPAGIEHLTRCTNLGEFGRTVVLDTWIELLDRRKPNGSWNLLVDQSSSNARIISIDYGFTFSEPLRPRGGIPVGEAGVSLRCPPELLPYVDWNIAAAAVDAMFDLSRDALAEIAGSIPAAWGISGEMQDDVVEYLFSRRDEVARRVSEEADKS